MSWTRVVLPGISPPRKRVASACVSRLPIEARETRSSHDIEGAKDTIGSVHHIRLMSSPWRLELLFSPRSLGLNV